MVTYQAFRREILHPMHTQYRPPDPSIWQGRDDGGPHSRLHQCVQCMDLATSKPSIDTHSKLSYGFLGFACDAGVKRNHGRPGAAAGPGALRPALAKLPLHRKQAPSFYDFGDVLCHDDNLEAAQALLGQSVGYILNQGIIPLILGGGHETAWGHYQGINQAGKADNLAIINFDTHFDLRPVSDAGLGSSGTPFLQIANAAKQEDKAFDYSILGVQQLGNTVSLFETAKQLNCKFLYADDFFLKPTSNTIAFLDPIIAKADRIYLSICLDVFSQAFAPGVSAPQPLGLEPWHIIPLIRHIAKSGKLRSFDIVELCPQFDEQDKTVRLATALIGDLIHAME